MAKPAGNPNCPPGLEYLTQLDQLLVHQQLELMEGKMFCIYMKGGGVRAGQVRGRERMGGEGRGGEGRGRDGREGEGRVSSQECRS